MDLEFFDCNAFIGSAQKGTWKPARGRTEILAAMDDAGIEKALIWHVAQQDCSIAEGNDLVSEAVGGERRLWGCWTILPPQTGEIPDAPRLFARMRDERIRAVRIFPNDHRYVPGRTALGSLLEGVIKHRVPVFVSVERGATDYPVIDRLLGEFPRLSCVLCDVGIWGVDRFVRPLLERFPGVRVETSYLALHDGVLESLVGRYGARRFLFGTGFPDRLPASAMLPLAHAPISDGDRRLIAAANLEGLLAEVKL
jgi:predicted TIM-barrel fold metal-dependent hydrolase